MDQYVHCGRFNDPGQLMVQEKIQSEKPCHTQIFFYVTLFGTTDLKELLSVNFLFISIKDDLSVSI